MGADSFSPKIINSNRLLIQFYNFRNFVPVVLSNQKCKFDIFYVIFSFTWRAVKGYLKL